MDDYVEELLEFQYQDCEEFDDESGLDEISDFEII